MPLDSTGFGPVEALAVMVTLVCNNKPAAVNFAPIYYPLPRQLPEAVVNAARVNGGTARIEALQAAAQRFARDID